MSGDTETEPSGAGRGGGGRPARALGGHRAGLALLLALALPLLFAQLGTGVLWADEADTAVFARTILREGIPYAWDGVTLTDSDLGRRLTPGLVLVGTPLLPYYVTAASFGLFGESVLAARLPFALAGLASVGLLYALVWRTTADRAAAWIAGALLLSSVQFLLYTRDCRHYGLNVMLSLLLLHAFVRLRERPRGIGLVVTAALLFHTHPLPACATLAALGALTLVHPDYRPLARSFWTRIPWLVPLTLPFVLWSWSGWHENSSPMLELSELPARLMQFAWETSVAVPWLAWCLLLPFSWRRLSARDRSFLALVAALLAGYAVLTPLMLHVGHLWLFGLRYVCALLAIGAAGTALLAVRASRGSTTALAAIVLLLASTHLGANALPWLWLAPGTSPAPRLAAAHVPEGLAGKLLRTEWGGFARELRERDPGTVSEIVAALRREAGPGELLITNYAWESLYFHTGLPQALKAPEYAPVLADARRAGLPDYVFGVDGTRWLVWRWVWEGYQGYRFDQVAAAIRARGGSLERVARFDETIWENRPELHFHRFPGLRYDYPSSMTVHRDRPPRDAELYLVRWPGEAPGDAGGDAS